MCNNTCQSPSVVNNKLYCEFTLSQEQNLKIWKINVRENRRDNPEWTIQRHWQHWVHKKMTNKKHNIEN
jgi:hypothetical protein